MDVKFRVVVFLFNNHLVTEELMQWLSNVLYKSLLRFLKSNTSNVTSRNFPVQHGKYFTQYSICKKLILSEQDAYFTFLKNKII
jgi:hypothetical protein